MPVPPTRPAPTHADPPRTIGALGVPPAIGRGARAGKLAARAALPTPVLPTPALAVVASAEEAAKAEAAKEEVAAAPW